MNVLAKHLTPCTKCGAKAELVEHGGWWRVKCTKCNAAMHHEVPSPYEAVAQWNATTAHVKARGMTSGERNALARIARGGRQ